jgi:hypothetical protein
MKDNTSGLTGSRQTKCHSVSWQRKAHSANPAQKSPPEGRLAVGWGEFVLAGIEGVVPQCEGDPGSTILPLKMKSTQPAGGQSGMARLEVDVPIEEAARFD